MSIVAGPGSGLSDTARLLGGIEEGAGGTRLITEVMHQMLDQGPTIRYNRTRHRVRKLTANPGAPSAWADEAWLLTQPMVIVGCSISTDDPTNWNRSSLLLEYELAGIWNVLSVLAVAYGGNLQVRDLAGYDYVFLDYVPARNQMYPLYVPSRITLADGETTAACQIRLATMSSAGGTTNTDAAILYADLQELDVPPYTP